ncbi:MAG: PKD domain-containing protein [Candidatus Kapabacteria bacterium]|nr:PKD domain-containing protein [Candidatus Kapabacteria bacterium]
MKKIMLMLLLSLVLKSNIYSKDSQILDSSITSGWVQVNNYWEQSYKIEPITYIKLNSANNLIYTNCDNGAIRKWNLDDGKFIKKFDKLHINQDINTDREEYVTQGNIGWPSYEYNDYILSLNNDSLIRKINVAPATWYQSYQVNLTRSVPSYNKQNNRIIQRGYCENGRFGGYYDIMNCGVLQSIELDSGKYIHYVSAGMVSSVNMSENSKLIAYSSYTYAVVYRIHNEITNYYNALVDSNNKIHPFLLENGAEITNDMINGLQFSPDGNLILGSIGAYYYIWQTSNMKPVHKFRSFQTAFKDKYSFLGYIYFTNDSKRLITFLNYNTNDNKKTSAVLQILNLEGEVLKDSIFTKDGYNNKVICKIDSTNKFLIGGNDGVLRLFEEELMNKGLVAYFNKDSVTYFTNQPIQFRDFSDGKVISRFWDFGDSSTSTEQNPIHTYKKSGDYSVKLIVYDGKLYDTLIKKNYIQLRVKAGFTSSDLNVIAPFKVDFVNNSKGDNKIFKWYFGDGDSTNAPVPSHNYTKAGLYDVKLIVSDGVYSDTLIKKAYIKVVLPLQAGFEISNNIGITPFKVDFKNVSTGEINSYKWYFGDGDSSVIASPSHTYTKGGNFTVTLIVSDGISSSTYTKEKFISVSDNLSVEGGPAKEEIPPFSPNPVKDKLFIQINEFNNTDKIQIIDLNGRKLLESELKETIDVSSLSKGIYFLKIGNRQWKFVKE